MSVISKLRAALSPIGLDTALDEYTGSNDSYIVYNIATEYPDQFVDDVPVTETIFVQVHWYLPSTGNYLANQKKIKNALFEAGFMYPSVALNTMEKDTGKRHICFETEYESEVC